MKIKLLGIDLAKNVFQLCALNHANTILFKCTVRRVPLRSTITQVVGWSLNVAVLALLIKQRCVAAPKALDQSRDNRYMVTLERPVTGLNPSFLMIVLCATF